MDVPVIQLIWSTSRKKRRFMSIASIWCKDRDAIRYAPPHKQNETADTKLCAKECSKIWKSCCFFFRKASWWTYLWRPIKYLRELRSYWVSFDTRNTTFICCTKDEMKSRSFDLGNFFDTASTFDKFLPFAWIRFSHNSLTKTSTSIAKDTKTNSGGCSVHINWITSVSSDSNLGWRE